ncbi:LOW QUALITY PROTEIN: hypothetical protein V1477_002772 [Vespula maculifrons]|uniref:Uncharacterized protein n=1 Tax=Vespula maculifrons TaxID=7453 RepID=A0ABD2CVR1_VESMC
MRRVFYEILQYFEERFNYMYKLCIKYIHNDTNICSYYACIQINRANAPRLNNNIRKFNYEKKNVRFKLNCQERICSLSPSLFKDDYSFVYAFIYLSLLLTLKKYENSSQVSCPMKCDEVCTFLFDIWDTLYMEKIILFFFNDSNYRDDKRVSGLLRCYKNRARCENTSYVKSLLFLTINEFSKISHFYKRIGKSNMSDIYINSFSYIIICKNSHYAVSSIVFNQFVLILFCYAVKYKQQKNKGPGYRVQ